MEDAASEISDWEVLSAASACGGDDHDDVVVFSGGGGDVLNDHFALVPSVVTPPSGAGFSAEDSWPEAGDAPDEEGRIEDLESFDGFDSVSGETFNLVAGVSTVQLQVGAVDGTRESSVPEAAAAVDATWSAERSLDESIDAEIEQQNDAMCRCGELHCALQPTQHALGEALDFDATTVTDASQIEVSDNSNAQLEDGVVAGTESSCLEDVATTDGIPGEQAEQEQGNDNHAASGCDELDGEVKDDALPLVETPGTGEGEKQVVWWRLPFKLLHYCAWKVKPIWSFSIAAALLGLVVLGRRMYRMKRKARGMPQIKIAFDDKRTSRLADRASRLNEAFLIARRVPMLRTSSGAVLPWSMVQER